MNQLTSKVFWDQYWSKKFLYQKIGSNFAFSKLFHRVLDHKKYKSMIEVGGYPGSFAIYFRKYFGYSTTLLDYVINKKVINQLLKYNNLKSGDITIIKADLFKKKIKEKYDLVFSLGFIEHFDDTKDVISRHWSMVSKGGTMIIGLPNFLGINGFYQLMFDPSNLNVHNLDSMEIANLHKILLDLKPKNYYIEYVGGALVWLENLKSRSSSVKLLTKLLNIIGILLTKIGINNKAVSTHIFIVAEK